VFYCVFFFCDTFATGCSYPQLKKSGCSLIKDDTAMFHQTAELTEQSVGLGHSCTNHRTVLSLKGTAYAENMPGTAT
jgi:hypothetical protein